MRRLGLAVLVLTGLLRPLRAQAAPPPWIPASMGLLQGELAARYGEAQRGRIQRGLLEEVCAAPAAARVARLLRTRLGRPLEPFDIWYGGFGAGDDLDARARRRYPDAAACQRDQARLFQALGFAPERAAWLGERIQVEPARGPGHVRGPGLDGLVRLRLPLGPGGLDRAGFTRALHLEGHAAAACLARQLAPSPLLAGTPAPACAEALAFLVQAHARELLGEAGPDPAGAALDAFWATYAGAGSALVELDAWHWLYGHPQADPAAFRGAVLDAARAVWNRWFAPVLGPRDSTLLASPGPMVDGRLRLVEFPLGRLMAFQLQGLVDRTGRLGPVFERLAGLGRLTPDLWLERTTGHPLGAGSLLQAAAAALDRIEAAGEQ